MVARLLSLFVVLLIALTAQAQTTGAPTVFLDCDRCDFTYIRTEIPFVNYVRDRQSADVHVLVTDQPTGSGGREYNLEFIGLRTFSGLDQNLRYVAPQFATDDEERAGLAQILQLGLLPYVAQTPVSGFLSVVYEEEEGVIDGGATPIDDPWNSWVLDLDFGGSFGLEEQQNRYAFDGSLEADRITEAWRVRSSVSAFYNERNFDNEGETITSTRSRRAANASAVRSLSDHWSAGAFVAADRDTRFNRAFSARLTPAIEYSVFPYEEVDRKELTVAYYAGVSTIDYFEQTIFGKTSERLVSQSLQIRLNVTQPWGEAFASLRGSNYFHDLSNNRLDFFGRVSVRLFKGLSIRMNLSADRIRDQLFLPAGDASLEEILLQQRQLATSYDLSGSLGLSYTFGSIYNNVVNTRL